MTQKTMMKAAILENYGTEFVIAEIPRPVAGPGQVLVRIAASGVNPLDTKIRSGNAAHARHPLPAILGIDMAGYVEQIGPDVTGFSVGDAVYGMTGGVGDVQGSLAQYAAVDARLLAHKPDGFSMQQAASLPLIFITAWEGLIERIDVRSGQTVLIIGAGGVGQCAIQIAQARGARVFAIDGPERTARIAELGATAIDYTAQNVDEYVTQHTGGAGFNVVYDTIGALETAFAAVAHNGHVTSCLGWGTHALAPLSFKAATYSGVFTLIPLLSGRGRTRHGQILAEATKMANHGLLSITTDPRKFTLDQVSEAHRAIENRHTKGKLVITIDQQ